ncbi:site-specific integrase [uncultured Pseudoteredinibacter sp.]|uniref:site-specific integrase n=1 Tax=uncultured Pseudoteredinibacter sp. TaxID=1641701 RepID=UPI002603E92A|nr:site-specific integrase [uncultured Pseudoteredinibacter sp.]
MEAPSAAFSIQPVQIDWDRLVAKRPTVLDTINAMPAYLLKPKILMLLDAEKQPTNRLILKLMWATGARVSGVLALKPTSFVDYSYDAGVVLKTLKQWHGSPTQKALKRSPKSYIAIIDQALEGRIQIYLYKGPFKKIERIYPMCRQSVNRHIYALVERGGGASFVISSHKFRYSFAIHLLLNERLLKYLSQQLGHKTVDSTEINTNVFTVDGTHFMDGVDFQ